VAAAAPTATPLIAMAGPAAPPTSAVASLEAGAADVVGAPLRPADAALLWRHVYKRGEAGAGAGAAAAAAAAAAAPAPAVLPLFTGSRPPAPPGQPPARAVRFASDTAPHPSARPSPGIVFTVDTPPHSHQAGGRHAARSGTAVTGEGEEGTGDEGGPSCEVSAAAPPPAPKAGAKAATASATTAAAAAAAEDEEAASVAESLWALMRGPAAGQGPPTGAGAGAATTAAVASPAPRPAKRATPKPVAPRPKAAKAARVAVVAVHATAASGAAAAAPAPPAPAPAAAATALALPPSALTPHPLDDPAAPRTPAICAANRAAAFARFQAKKAAARAAGAAAGGVRYESRRRLAVARPRVKGQFVTAEVAAAYHAAEAIKKGSGAGVVAPPAGAA